MRYLYALLAVLALVLVAYVRGYHMGSEYQKGREAQIIIKRVEHGKKVDDRVKRYSSPELAKRVQRWRV